MTEGQKMPDTIGSTRAIRRLSSLALSVAFLVVVVGGGLGATIKLAGAVVAPGTLEVSSYVKPIQHDKGGTVAAIDVHDGQRVQAGELLVRLDDAQPKANRAIFRRRLDGLDAKIARLTAERDDRTSVQFPADLLARGRNADVGDIIAGEQRLFDDRRALRQSRKSQLQQKIAELNQQIDGLAAQQDAGRQEIDIINKELGAFDHLATIGSIPATNLYSLKREGARATGSLGNLAAEIAEAHEKITETRLQILQIDDDHANEVSDQLRQAQTDQGQCAEQLAASEDELKHLDIRSPQAGVVDQLQVHAPGAVIRPGDLVMRVVPDEDSLVANIKLRPQDVDQVAPGQAVRIRLPAFNQGTTPELTGHVERISADLVTDQHSGTQYYALRAVVPTSEWQRLKGLTPMSGMPVESFLETPSRTFMAYLTKPITDQMKHAFREE